MKRGAWLSVGANPCSGLTKKKLRRVYNVPRRKAVPPAGCPPAKEASMKQLTWVCICVLWISGEVAAQSNPVPFINQPLVPASAAPGSGAFTLTVNGSGFAPTAVVSWNESFRPTTVLSSTRLQASIMASDVAGLGTARVRVVNVDAHNETSDIAYFPTRTPSPGVAFAQDANFSVPGVPGDFNNDGKLDLVNVYAANKTTLEADVYLSKGNVKFQPPIQTQFTGYVGLSVGQVIVGDFNGDHNLDLVVSVFQFNRSQLTVLFGDGKGRFTLGPSFASYDLYSLSSYDIDGDGNLDLVGIVDRYRNSRVVVLFGNGDGTFPHSVSPNAGGFPGSVIVGDFNEDGKLDLAVYNAATQPSISVLLNKGNRTFRAPVRYSTPTGSGMATADVNSDNHLDLVADSGALLLGKGDGTFANGVNLGSVGYGIVAGDFNGDGKLDLVEGSGSGLSVLLGNGDGTFQSPIETRGGGGYLSDYNHDGRLDFVGFGLFWQVPANLYPALLAFGQQVVGTTSASQTATLSNSDAQPLTGIQIALGGTNANQFSENNNCPPSLPVGGSCQIQVTFAPTTVGNKSASLNVAYAGLGSPQSVALTGTGEQKQMTSVSLQPSSLTFATQNLKTTSTPQTATLTNNGNTDVTISSISTTAPFHQSNNCPSTLRVGQSCQIKVTFRPTTIGQANGTLSVTDNAPDSPQTVALAGQGTLITLSPIGINFGDQKVGTSSNPVPVSLSNQGTLTLNISQITIGGANPNDFSQTNNCGNSLPGGSQCTIQVTFTPTQTGTRSAKLQVLDDVNPSPQEVALGGNGT